MPALVLAALALDAGAVQASPFAEAEANQANVKSAPYEVGTMKAAYSDADKAAGKAGNVFVRALVGTDGVVQVAEVLRSSAPPEFEAAALAAVKAVKFRPGMGQDYKPVAALVTRKISFGTSAHDPDFVTRSERVYDPAERALGHFGKVQIAAEVGSDGKLVNPVVEISSKAPALDAEAMRAATSSLYRPYHDAAGKPVTAPIKVSYDFNSYTSEGNIGGIMRYTCDQFARDHTWWKSAHGPKERSEIYHMMLGLGTIASNALANPAGMVEYVRAFEGRWDKAIRTCQAKPDKLFIDVFKPEGEFARRLATAPARNQGEGQ